MQWAMLGFQLLYIFEGEQLNNHNLMGQILNVGYHFIYSSFFKKTVKKSTLFIYFLLIMKKVSHILNFPH